MTPTATLSEVAEINPRDPRPSTDEVVAFVGMADLSAETGVGGPGIERPFGEVSKGYTIFKDQDVLVAKITPCYENGKTGQARLKRAIGVGSTEFHVVRPHPDRLDAKYALHFLRQERVRLNGERRMTGSAGQRRVPTTFLSELSIPVPPIEEQRRIAAILDHADAIRTKRRQVFAHLDTLEQAVFYDRFGDPIKNCRSLRTARLGELGALDRGVSKHRPQNDPRLLGGPYPLIQTGDVASSGGRIESFSATYSALGLAQSKLWPAGTLCITIAANIAKTGVLAFDACFPDSVVGFTADPEMTTFVRVWLGFIQKALEAAAPQSAQKNINLAVLRELQVPTPKRPDIVTFARQISQVERFRGNLQRARDVDRQLFASLQSRAFRGEL